ncbi:hypothetical protein IE81DRAFT_350250 [Ceraceosorus guamensis]|uniref:Uncharacterized protein n=1 Tax=Ceraceosorus guamensis TaxID=1522189 RepID=A0A316VP49_9BASI|nr:hypothetical protein IE81DRAFT_350250 [Ceraceosorus guamensis]PWN39347.1 hypothetical protein IE81DRAFT_350250 [Ceraceosorus guamensis]
MARPSLGARAVSDMAPLVARPMPSAQDAEVHQSRVQVNNRLNGTRAVVGGRNVAAGSELRQGGRAPMCPFLSLPPAPEAEQLQRASASTATQPPTKFARAGSEGSIKDPTTVSAAAARSWTMVRSYSMPVATQAEFDQQYRQRQAGMPLSMADQTLQRWENGWSTSSSSFGSSQGVNRSEGEQAHATNVKRRRFDRAGTSPRNRLSPLTAISDNTMREVTPISPLSKSFDLALDVVDENTAPSLDHAPSSMSRGSNDYFGFNKAETDQSSDSDEDVATPRATHASSYSAKSKNDVEFESLDWINPAHFTPPEQLV